MGGGGGNAAESIAVALEMAVGVGGRSNRSAGSGVWGGAGGAAETARLPDRVGGLSATVLLRGSSAVLSGLISLPVGMGGNPSMSAKVGGSPFVSLMKPRLKPSLLAVNRCSVAGCAGEDLVAQSQMSYTAVQTYCCV